MGTVVVNGRVSALIELGAGFHPEISGRENVYINGMMLGLSKREVAARFDEIVEFAELQDFIDAPVKAYSSGMYMRLGFAVAIHVDPDVLLVDEVLAVGDEAFTHKCLDKFAEFRRRGRTVLLVTHSLDLVSRFCDEALWLDAGVIREQGDPRRVIDAYLLDVAESEDAALRRSASGPAASGVEAAAEGVANASSTDESDSSSSARPDAPPDMFRADEGRWGSREVEIVGVELFGRNGRGAHVFQSGDPLEVRMHVKANQPVADIVFGVGIFNAEGVCCYGTNTQIDGATKGALSGSGEVRFAIDRLDLIDGTYKLDVAAHRENGAPYDYHRLLYTIRVSSRAKEAGIFRPPHRWFFSGGVRVTGLGTSE
jgi:ABC-type multidrug transport system ATPase subunit